MQLTRRLLMLSLGLTLVAEHASAAMLSAGSLVQNNNGKPYISYDIRQCGAVCDGTTDDGAAIQCVIDAANAEGAGGATIIGPSNVVCAVGTSLTAKTGASFVGLPGFRLKALSGLTNWILGSSGTGGSSTDNITVEGVHFDLDQVKVPAISIAEGANLKLRNNLVTWNYDNDTSNTNTTAFSMVKVKCKAGGSDLDTTPAEPCAVIGNVIQGSDTDAQDDTCLEVNGAGTQFFSGHTIVSENTVQFCGGYGIYASGGFVDVENNVVSPTWDTAINFNATQSLLTGNEAENDGTEPSILITQGNVTVVENQVSVFAGGLALRVLADAVSIGGVFIDGGYYAKGVDFRAQARCSGTSPAGAVCHAAADCTGNGTCTTTWGSFTHCVAKTIVTQTGGVTPGVNVENVSTDFLVSDLQDVTSASSTAHPSILFTNMDSTADANIKVLGGVLGPTSASAAIGVKFDGTAGGFKGVTVQGVSFGVVGDLIGTGISVVGSPSVWDGAIISGNNFEYATDALSGFNTDATMLGTTIPPDNRGLQPADLEPVVKMLENRTASLAKYSVVDPSSGNPDAVAQAAANSIVAIGCSLGPDAPSSGAALRVAIGGVSECLVDGTVASITRGDQLAMSATAGKLRKATAGDRVVGVAMETTSSATNIRVLIEPGGTFKSQVRKTSDEVRDNGTTGATLTDDADLTLPVAASKTYRVNAFLDLFIPSGTTSNAQVAITAPSGSTLRLTQTVTSGANGTTLASCNLFTSGTSCASSPPVPVTTANVDSTVHIEGDVVVSTTAGNIVVQWAQQTANAQDLTLKAGGWLSVTPMP